MDISEISLTLGRSTQTKGAFTLVLEAAGLPAPVFLPSSSPLSKLSLYGTMRPLLEAAGATNLPPHDHYTARKWREMIQLSTDCLFGIQKSASYKSPRASHTPHKKPPVVSEIIS